MVSAMALSDDLSNLVCELGAEWVVAGAGDRSLTVDVHHRGLHPLVHIHHFIAALARRDRAARSGLVNRRIETVARLKRYKDEHGIAFVDPNREAQMIADRLRENAGPLSEDGLRAFYSELLALIKREV